MGVHQRELVNHCISLGNDHCSPVTVRVVMTLTTIGSHRDFRDSQKQRSAR